MDLNTNIVVPTVALGVSPYCCDYGSLFSCYVATAFRMGLDEIYRGEADAKLRHLCNFLRMLLCQMEDCRLELLDPLLRINVRYEVSVSSMLLEFHFTGLGQLLKALKGCHGMNSDDPIKAMYSRPRSGTETMKRFAPELDSVDEAVEEWGYQPAMSDKP